MASNTESEKRLNSPGRPVHGILTQRETELLPLLAEGLSHKEIATKLHIATQTVKTHLQNIYRKLNIKGRTAAAKEARVLGVIPRDSKDKEVVLPYSRPGSGLQSLDGFKSFYSMTRR